MGRQEPEPELRRQLGLLDTAAVSLGAIIGAGIFVVLGEAAGMAGAGLVGSVVIGAVVAVLDGLSAAQLGANYPRVGGAYEFGYILLRPWVGFAAGLLYLLTYLTAGTTLSLTFAAYLQPLIPGLPLRAAAVGVAVAALAVNLAGVQQSRRVNNALVAFKVIVLGIFVGIGLAFLGRWQQPDLRSIDPAGVMRAGALFFFAYTGFARPVTLAGEVRNPARNLPLAIILALALSTLLYLAVAIVGQGLIGAQGLAESGAPLRAALAPTGLGWAQALVSLGALVATTDVLLTGIWALSRVILAMARRGDLPAVLGRLSAGGVPRVALLVAGGLIILLTATLSFGPALAASSLAVLLYYGITNWAALRLSRRQRLYPRFVPIAGLVGTGALVFALPAQSLIVVAAVLAAGLLYYYLWHRRRTRD